jgi:hypothetical protein
VIKIGPDDLSRADVESVRVNLPNVRAALDDGYTRIEDWDGEDSTPETALRISVGELLRSPVQDWKAMLPPYTHHVERRPWESSQRWTSDDPLLSVEVPESRTYAYTMVRLRLEGGTEAESNFEGESALRPAMDNLVAQQRAFVESSDDWDGSLLIRVVYTGGYLTAGSGQIAVSLFTSYGTADRFVHIPVLVWDATSFEDWLWPDPTMSGLLPDLQSTQQLLSTFGFEEDHWDSTLVLDWTGSDGAWTEPPMPPPPPPTTGVIVGVASLSPGIPGDLGNARVACFTSYDDWNSDRPRFQVRASGQGPSVTFLFPTILPGSYLVEIWKDTDNSGSFNAGDFFGITGTTSWPAPTPAFISVMAGRTTTVSLSAIAIP